MSRDRNNEDIEKARAAARKNDAEKAENINEGEENVKTEQNENGSRGSDGFMSDEEINKLADEGVDLLSYEKYCEQILFGESLQMEPADKKWAWKQYVAYLVKAKNEGRKSAEYSESSLQKAKSIGERIEAMWEKFLPFIEGIAEKFQSWRTTGNRLLKAAAGKPLKDACELWQKQGREISDLMREQAEGDEYFGMSKEEADQHLGEFYLRTANNDFPAPARPEAFYGIAGEVTKAICEGSELLPEAVLAQFLCIIGNMMGRGLHKNQEGRHGTVINLAVVGSTASGAKGGSLRAVKLLIREVDHRFFFNKLKGGHNSPEALLAEICDEVEGLGKDGPIILEENIPDKRLVVVEEELTRLFAVNNRNGSGMSEKLREFYDSPPFVRAMSRQSKLAVTCPHVSILGHVTPEGLKHSLPSVEAFNGFANRFMYIASRRTRSIPEPVDVDWSSVELNTKVQYLRHVAQQFHPNEASITNPEFAFTFSEPGRAKWHEIYHRLSEQSAGKSGMAGAMIARAKPTLLRLAIIYAALDLTQEIGPEHLEAAEALWEYSLASVLWAFGENSGNPNADKIYRALQRARRKGMTRTDISEYVFNRRASSYDITEALSLLKREGKVLVKRLPNPKGKGRPVETWFEINSIPRN